MNYWQRLGGENAITLRAWLLLAPISIFLTFAFVPEGRDGGYPLWMLVGLLAHLATGAVLAVARFSYLAKGERKSRPVSAVITFLLAGIARGATVSFSSELFGLVQQAEYLLRMRSGAVLVAFWFGFAAIMIDASRQYRDSFNELQNRLAEYSTLERESATAVLGFRGQIIQEVEGIIKSALAKSSNPDQLREVGERVIAPLSRQLYAKDSYPKIQQQIQSAQQRSRRIGLRSTLFTVFSQTPFNPGTVTVLAVGGTAASRLWTAEPLSFALDVLANVLWIFLIMGAANRLTEGKPVLRTLSASPVWLLIGIGSGVITDITQDGQLASEPSGIFLLATNLLAAAIFAAFLAGYEFQREQKLSELSRLVQRADWLRARTKQALWCERRRLARVIHSEVQSRLLATATRVAARGQSSLGGFELDQLHDDCHLAMIAAERVEPLERFLEQTQEVWQGAIELRVVAGSEVFDLLQADSTASLAAIEVIREAINNAAKHAKPSAVSIELELAESTGEPEDFLKLKISNDGVLESQRQSSGLGAQILDEVSPDWSLEVKNNQAILQARIPVRTS